MKMTDKAVALYSPAPKTECLIGSGFCVSQDGLVVSASHVIKKDGQALPKIFGSMLIDDKPVPFELELIKSITDRDIALLKIKKWAEDKKRDTPYFNLLRNNNEISCGDEVMVCGFPGAFTDKEGKTIPSSFPLLRKGVISSLYEKMGENPVIILDMMGVKGFSGAPVVHLKTQRFIAVFSQIPGGSQNTGFSLAYPIKPDDLKGI